MTIGNKRNFRYSVTRHGSPVLSAGTLADVNAGIAAHRATLQRLFGSDVDPGVDAGWGSYEVVDHHDIDDRPLEDVFAGHVELTAGERAYVQRALAEFYLSGGDERAIPGNRLEVSRRVQHRLFGGLRLTMMVVPDRTALVTVEEHGEIVRAQTETRR